MMKNKLDERQNQVVNGITAISFYVMFIISVVGIIAQLIFLDAGVMSVLGESITLLFGGIIYLVGCIKKGIFSQKGRPLSVIENVLSSVICSGIFSLFYGIAISRKASSDVSVGKYIGYFFVGITLVCFIVLFIMDKCSALAQRRNEQKYDD